MSTRDSNNEKTYSNQGQTNEQISQQDVKSFKFTRLPFDIQDIGSIAPIGEFTGITRQTAATSHFAGGYRHYVFSRDPGKRDYNVYAPSDSKITATRFSKMTGQHRFNFTIGDQDGPAFYYLDHIQSLSPELTSKLKESFGGEIPQIDTVEQLPKPVDVKS